VLRNGKAKLLAYPIGVAWARELSSELLESAGTETALGPLTVGIAPSRSTHHDDALTKLQRAVRELLPQPAPGTWIVVLERPKGGLVIEIASSTDDFVRDRWLRAIRSASQAELAAAEPPRVELRYAHRGGKIGDLIASCPDTETALRIDDPDRRVAAGEPFKCTDR
jgi:hypothetical protein